MAEQHWRQRLNNLLQSTHLGVNALQWQNQQVGGQHDGLWHSAAIIAGVEYGNGRGRSLGCAREEAARLAYQVLLHRVQTGQLN